MLALILVLFLPLRITCSIIKQGDKIVHCNDLPEEVLSNILGPAFNSRYMSIDFPNEDEKDADGKRKASSFPSFYVDDGYARELGDEPAWDVDHVKVSEIGDTSKSRRRRSSKNAKQWECESKISWIDLGADYFPRYLRSVECIAKTCWYGHYKCKPRSFTVKILRKKRGRCTVAKAGTTIGVDGLHTDLKQLWVWEERAINFCCDCSL